MLENVSRASSSSILHHHPAKAWTYDFSLIGQWKTYWDFTCVEGQVEVMMQPTSHKSYQPGLDTNLFMWWCFNLDNNNEHQMESRIYEKRNNSNVSKASQRSRAIHACSGWKRETFSCRKFSLQWYFGKFPTRCYLLAHQGFVRKTFPIDFVISTFILLEHFLEFHFTNFILINVRWFILFSSFMRFSLLRFPLHRHHPRGCRLTEAANACFKICIDFFLVLSPPTLTHVNCWATLNLKAGRKRIPKKAAKTSSGSRIKSKHQKLPFNIEPNRNLFYSSGWYDEVRVWKVFRLLAPANVNI